MLKGTTTVGTRKIIKGNDVKDEKNAKTPTVASPKKIYAPPIVKNLVKKTPAPALFGTVVSKKPKARTKNPYVPNLSLNYGAHLRNVITKPVNKWVQRRKNIKSLNKILGTQLKSVDELQSGAVYCQLFDKLYPGSLDMSKVKPETDMPYDYVRHYILLKEGFKTKFVKKFIPIEALVTQKVDRQYDFLDWFVKFYDMMEERRRVIKAKPKKIVKERKVKPKFIMPKVKRNSMGIKKGAQVGDEKPKRKKRVRFSKEVSNVINGWPLSSGAPLNT
ncbi:microtubule-associated protein RP/EB family member 1-like [Teleopsis dalmanni]|uniref:microtubule-associated protein RP/EB family member 1-like n=1 Tax=Teleopsis dalmanni TaxID=139649 RepID=UPI0018CEBDBF|nr:microtubule-associated protein RP/EB family member 1-like [Teleopsis dalmanni]